MALKDQPTHKGGVGFYHKTLGIDDKIGIFNISKMKKIPSNTRDSLGNLMRCDSGRYGPYGFHEWNEENQICSCGSLDKPDLSMGHHLVTLSNLSTVFVVRDIYPYGYIMYFELHNLEDEEECCKIPHSEFARSLQELFRLMVEWDFAYTELGNTESVAETCHNILNELQLSEDHRNWLLNTIPPEKVEKFLRGDINARQRSNIEDISDLEESFSNWLEQVVLNSEPLGAY